MKSFGTWGMRATKGEIKRRGGFLANRPVKLNCIRSEGETFVEKRGVFTLGRGGQFCPSKV